MTSLNVLTLNIGPGSGSRLLIINHQGLCRCHFLSPLVRRQSCEDDLPTTTKDLDMSHHGVQSPDVRLLTSDHG